jgi:inhibitor of KinA
MNWASYGPNAWLLRFAERVSDDAFARGEAIRKDIERHSPPGLSEVVPAFTTLLLEFDPAIQINPAVLLPKLSERFEAAFADTLPVAPVKEIPATYNGADLDRLARFHDLSTREVCHLHSEPIYKVYMLGFAPGFPYLGELNPRLHTPRLASPRARVTAGSLAIGGEHTGIYSIESPGGWNIIGHTTLRLFDPSQGDGEAMFLLKRGDRVKFVSPAGE